MENTKIEKYGLVDFIKEHKIALTLISLIFLGLWAYQEGVPVPTSEPFVKFEIVTESDTYYLGERVPAQFLIRNLMPFPVRIEITDTMYTKYRYTDKEGESYASIGGGKEKPYTIKIAAGHAYNEGHTLGPASTVRTGTLMFIFEHGDQILTHTVSIVE